MAETADRHHYYQLAVQCVESEIDMVDKTYRELRARRATVLREDFCGTANTSCEWVRRRKTNRAIGLDLDESVLQWGRKNNINKLNADQRARIELLRHDVRLAHNSRADIARADIILAMNFSYMLFKKREQLREYFTAVRAGLNDNGVFMLDCYGGYESWCNSKEKTKHKKHGFTYIWQQRKFNPIDGTMNCDIHFKFKDGSRIKRAFTYAWRIWTLPEIREILAEAGFAKSIVYWEGTDEKTGEGNDIYSPSETGDDDPSWIVYVAAVK